MTDFAKFTSCDIADGLVFTNLNDGGAIPFLRQQSGPARTVSGPAYTVEYAPLSDPRPPVKQHYIDSAPRGSVILIATSAKSQLSQAPYTTLTNSLYGGLMSTRAQYLGCAGTVVLGQIRDIAEQKSLNFPVWSYGVGVCAPNKLAKVVAVNEPLQIGERTIQPGDTVVADANGVVVIPHELQDKVMQYVPQRVSADSLAADDIKKGVPAAEAQKTRRAAITIQHGKN